MTVTSTPAELNAAAARAQALGDPHRAHQLYQEAADNAKNTAFTPTAQTAVTTAVTAAASALADSHVIRLKGHDGKTISG